MGPDSTEGRGSTPSSRHPGKDLNSPEDLPMVGYETTF